jgi:isopenicillin-N N-acyltransferase like protein
LNIQVIRAAGSHYEIGRAVGSAARKKLTAAVDSYKKILAVEGWRGPWSLPEQYLKTAEDLFPHLVEELHGMADGSGQSFGDLFFLNALEEALEWKEPRRCTTVGLTAEGGSFLGHNEDWFWEDVEHVIVIHARPAGKPEFISVTAAPFLAAVGMNEAGLAQGVNSVSSLDNGAGVPRMLTARAVLEGETLQDAVVKATPPRRAGGYNHLLVSGEGDMGNLETSALEQRFLPGGPVIYHTNHYVHPEMQFLDKGASPHSLSRFRRLEQIQENLAGASDPCRALISVLQDHYDRPRSICKHAAEHTDHEGTIFSVIFDLAGASIRVAVGNPCRNRYQQISFTGED